MSVIVKNLKDVHYQLYAKGSPERIAELCLQTSLPKNFKSVLEQYSR